MAGKKTLRYYLKLLDSKPEELFNAPDGWENSVIKFARSAQYRGLIKSFSFPFKFVKRGAYLLRSAFYQYSVKAAVQLLIDKLNPNPNNYSNIFTGRVDFSKAEDERDSFTVNAVNGDFQAKLAAYEGVLYTIPLNVPEAVTVELPALTLKERATLNMVNRNNAQADTFPGLTIVDNQQNATEPSVQDVQSEFVTDPDYSTSGNWFYIARKAGSVRVTLEAKDIALFPAGGQYRITIRNQAGNLVRDIYYYSGGTNPPTTVTPINFLQDFTYNTFTSERFYLYFDASTDGTRGDGFVISSGTFTIKLEYDTISPSSTCKAVPAMYVFQHLVNKMNGIPLPATSDLLTGMMGAVYLTSSTAIRTITAGATYNAGETLAANSTYIVRGAQITYGGIVYNVDSQFSYSQGVTQFTTTDGGFVQLIANIPSIQIKFKDFYQSVKSWMGGQAGFGVENEMAVLEDLRYFYRASLVSMDVGNIANWKLTPATDLIPNSINIGFEDQQYDSINGTQEVNSSQVFTTPVDTLDTEESANALDLISVIRADPYGIEQARIVPVDSSASRSDNDTFALWLDLVPDSSGVYHPLSLEDVTYSGVTAEYYNWKLSPKQSLLRGSAYLASLFYNMKSYRLTFASGLKNTSMVVTDGGKRFAEGEDVLINSLGDPIFLPYYVNINVGLPFNALELLQNQGYGVITHKFLGRDYRGFIEAIQVNGAVNNSQDFKLLLSPDNNLFGLIR